MTYDNDLLTPDEVADRLSRHGVRVSVSTLRNRVRDGLLPHVRVGSPPRPGARDQRRVLFTSEQADQIVHTLAQHVPAAMEQSA